MKKIFLPLMLIIFLMTGCGNGDDSSKSVSKKFYGQKFIIGIDDEFAPMGFHDTNGELIGFDIDLAKEVAERMGIEFEFTPIDWDKKEDEISSGRIDMIWNGLDVMDEYREYMIFSKPYMDNRQILLVRRGDTQNVHSEYDLAGKIVGTQSGSNSEDYIRANEKLKNIFADFKTYRNIKMGFEALSKGELDALIIDEIAGRYEMVKRSKEFKIIEVTIGPVTEFAIGFNKSLGDLRDEIQKVFDAAIKDGTARKISEKWFKADLIK